MTGAWSNGEVTDDIREICKHEKVLAAIATGLTQEVGLDSFEPSSVEQQVVSGMNYRITGKYGKVTATINVWFQSWNGGIQTVKFESFAIFNEI